MGNIRYTTIAMIIITLIPIAAIAAYVYTLKKLSESKVEVGVLKDENKFLKQTLSLCDEEKLALQQDTAQLRSHADKSFGAMSIFLKRLIAQGDGEWVAKKLGVKAPTPPIRNSWREMEQAQDL